MTLRRTVDIKGRSFAPEIVQQLERFNASDSAVQDLIYKQAVAASNGGSGVPTELSENEKILRNYLGVKSPSAKTILTAKIAETVWGLKYDTHAAFISANSGIWKQGKIYVATSNPNSHNYGTLPFEITYEDSGTTSRTIRLSDMQQGNGIKRENARMATVEEAIAFITKKLL